jgi:hypothetical protein
MNGAFGAVAIPNGPLSLVGDRAQQMRCLRVGVLTLSGFGQVGAEKLYGHSTLPVGSLRSPNLTRRCSRRSRLHFCPLRLKSGEPFIVPIRAGKRARG